MSQPTITQDELLTMTCLPGHRHELIYARCSTGQIPAEPLKWRVKTCAEHIINYWDCDFERMGFIDPFFKLCLPMYENWEYSRVDPLMVCRENSEDIGFLLKNGHHRSLVLSCLLLQDKIEFQPLPVDFITQTRWEEITAAYAAGIFFKDYAGDSAHYQMTEENWLKIKTKALTARGKRLTLQEIAEICLRIGDFSKLAHVHPLFREYLTILPRDFLFAPDPLFYKKVLVQYERVILHVRCETPEIEVDNLYIDDDDLHIAILLAMAVVAKDFQHTVKVKVQFSEGSDA